MTTKINDLRSALDYLRTIPGQLVEAYFQAVPVSGTCWDVNPKSWAFF